MRPSGARRAILATETMRSISTATSRVGAAIIPSDALQTRLSKSSRSLGKACHFEHVNLSVGADHVLELGRILFENRVDNALVLETRDFGLVRVRKVSAEIGP